MVSINAHTFKMFNVISRNKLQKIRKRGTYSRLLKKYRDRYKGLMSAGRRSETNVQPSEPELATNHIAEIDTQEERIINELNREGKLIVYHF